MIFGIGVDIVRVSRMQDCLDKYGERFARRILGESEWPEFQSNMKKAHFLAKRFAAKEAAVKAMGLGFRDGLHLKHICVGHDAKGKPVLEFTSRARELSEELGVGEGFISLSDEEDNAIAFVTLMLK